MSVLGELFWEFLKIALTVIGGGYAILAVADDVFTKKGWTKEGEITDEISVFQMIPGLIATHTAVYVGRKKAGIAGAMVAVLAVALPTIALFTLVAVYYDSIPVENAYLKSVFVGLRSALTGIIASAVIGGWRRNLKDVFSYAVMALAAFGSLYFGVAPTVLGAMVLGLAWEFGGGKFRSSALAFLVFLKYGVLCLGGGFVLIPMYIEDFVGPSAAFLQISAEEFSNVMALAQMTPGPVGVNAATYFGFRLGGAGGAVLASLCLVLPGSVLVYLALSSLDRFRESRIVRGVFRALRPTAVALMLVALAAFAKTSVLDGENNFNIVSAIIAIISGIMIMKKKLNVVLVILLSAFVAGIARADGITAEDFPDADSVLVDETESVVYRVDGTYDSTCECWVKILTEKGRREEGTFTLHYSRRYGSAKLLYVGAIDENGVEREIDVSSTTVDTTDNSSMKDNIYDPMDRRISCAIPGLRVGDTLHLKYTRGSFSPRCEGKWADISIMEWTSPFVKRTYTILSPKELPLKKIAVRNPRGNVRETHETLSDGSVRHTFVCENAKQIFAEPDMPRMETQVQHVRVSTAENWQEISKWYWDLCAPHLARTNEAITNKVEELGHDIRSIFKFVSQEVRYMGLTMEDTSPGFAPHDVDITFNNRYGVCRDKGALLVAMLRLAGFEAFPVLIHAGAKHDPEIPQPFFNHAVVAVDKGNREYELMDPTNENAKDLFPAYLCDKSFLVCRPDGETLLTSPVPSAEHNTLKVVSKGRLSSDGSMVLDNDILFGGINDTIYRHSFVTKKPADRVKYFERVVKRLSPGAELLKCEIEPEDMRDTDVPIHVRLSAKLPEMLLFGESRDELTVPYISRIFGMANFLFADNTSLDKRVFPLDIDTTAGLDETIEIDLGTAVGEAKELPTTTVTNGGYDYYRTFSVEGRTLKSERKLKITKVEFSPEEYVTLKNNLKLVEAAERKRPVFTKGLLAEADVHYMLEKTEVDIKSDKEWKETETIEKEILSYDGKKSSAELKIAFTPCVEALDVVSAVVSNKDGRVYQVSDREMNVMDCGWAASAPRYPASKTLIVNLPSVEIGSVISYTIVHSVTNAPTPYCAVFGFDAHEPLDCRVVRIDDWKREVVHPKQIANEPGQPFGPLWRDQMIVTRAKFAPIDLKVGEAELESGEKDMKEIRDWMARHVRVAGPAMYELPLELQLTDPETVIKEHYGTRLDYVRTLCALLRGAGYEADVVLTAANGGDPDEVRRRMKFEKPDVRAFSIALCRVRIREGGFLGFGGETKEYFLGTENEYTPLGASMYAGSDYFDPETCEFGVVTVPDVRLGSMDGEKTVIDIKEDGSAEISIESVTWGHAVGAFRKTFAEILPEDRSRLHQSLLGSISQAASAIGDLETDLEGYPAKRRFACKVPDYAMVSGGTITLQAQSLLSTIPAFTGKVRKTPFAVSAQGEAWEEVVVRFPKGYTIIEHLPDSFVFADPHDANKIWLTNKVSKSEKDGVVEVSVFRKVMGRKYTYFTPDYIELVNDRSRIADSRANRTIVVRKP